jgi:hypothetical protein
MPPEPSVIGQWHMVRQKELIEGASGRIRLGVYSAISQAGLPDWAD